MKKFILLACVGLGITMTSFAQTNQGTPDLKYRRSSLHTILIETDYFPRKETILKAYNKAPFPERYNDHTISLKSFDPKKYPLTDADRSARDKYNHNLAQITNNILADYSHNISNETFGIVNPDFNDLPLIINKFLTKEKVANLLVAKWYNRQPDGSFNMNLIGERGYYNASEMEANISKVSARGTASLADAGEELIKNTFVVVSKYNFISNELAARKIRDLTKTNAASIKDESWRKITLETADKTYEKAKEGYTVLTTSFLYQLVWNDSIAAVFYNDMWMDASHLDQKRKEAFDNTQMFKLQYIGTEWSGSLVLFSLNENRTEDQIIELATIRNADNVFAKLQKKYDVFKPKVPLYSGNPLSAKIGMKEGLEGGEKFEVLEQTIDPKTGLTKYETRGKITVEKNQVWDNRYNAADGPLEKQKQEDKKNIDRTFFKGGKEFYSGMLIRQIK